MHCLLDLSSVHNNVLKEIMQRNLINDNNNNNNKEKNTMLFLMNSKHQQWFLRN